jgi:hypothetical protein
MKSEAYQDLRLSTYLLWKALRHLTEGQVTPVQLYLVGPAGPRPLFSPYLSL